jgi:hypothetical protein
MDTFTATPETGPVEAPATADSIAAEIMGGGSEAPADIESVTEELVRDAEGQGEAGEAPESEEAATDPADEAAEEPSDEPPAAEEEGEDAFAKLVAEHPDLKARVKVNGETIEVPLSELVNGYSRTEDYKAKTAAVAEQRREAEAVMANADALAKQHYANQLEQATNLFAQYDPTLAEAKTINWEALKATDPAAYVAAQDVVNERLNVIRQMQAQAAQARTEAQQQLELQTQAEREQRFNRAADKIVEARPDLADEAKFREFAGTNLDYLRSTGFQAEEILDAVDDRVLTLADKARQWDAHVAAQKSMPERKVVPKSQLKPLKSDGGSSQPRSHFPANASRQSKGNWIANQILKEME